MSVTKIEWCDLSINPVKGLCPVACSYCYARRMYKRFKWDEAIRFDDQVLFGLPEKPKRIFVGSTMELFGKWVKDSWMEFILQTANLYPQHTFILGVSTTGSDNNSYLEDNFRDIQATVKFISIEPMLDYTSLDLRWVNWVIIGQQTPVKVGTTPFITWIKNIVTECDKLRTPVFLKNNLEPLLVIEKDNNQYAPLWANGGNGKLRQEFPK
jgi:protein gp37